MTEQWGDEQWQNQLTKLENKISVGQFDKEEHEVTIIGFGEISTILQFQEQHDWVVKRMPVFDSDEQAEKYLKTYLHYNQLLKAAGLNIPLNRESIVGNNPVSLYLMQQAFLPEQIANNALRVANDEQQKIILQMVICEIEKVFAYNRKQGSHNLLSCDGQMSNWALVEDNVYFIDTSTPLFKKDNSEQLEYELLLKSTPSFLRGIIRRFFLDDVLERYYDKRLVYLDLIANLQKEQLQLLIPQAIALVNPLIDSPLSEKIVEQYYRNDKFIWQVFLVFRKFDRWLYRYFWRKPYQYLLPEKIQR